MTPLELVGRAPETDDFLLYPEKRTAGPRVIAADPKHGSNPHQCIAGGISDAPTRASSGTGLRLA
jgi:hypothetical protein